MRILLVSIGFLALVATGRASERVLAQVTQPIGGNGAGIVLADVSYVDWFNVELDPWPSVRLTTAPNCIPTDRGTEDLNLANEAGLRVSLAGQPSNDPSNPQGLRGDTLDVVLSIPPDPTGSRRTWMDQLVPATVECVLTNARRYSPRLRFMKLTVMGNESFAQLSNTYLLERVPAPSTPRMPEIQR